jgi:hypothetical protein
MHLICSFVYPKYNRFLKWKEVVVGAVKPIRAIQSSLNDGEAIGKKKIH